MNCAIDPEWTPCGRCTCNAAGEMPYEKWVLKNGDGSTWFSSRVCPQRIVTDDSRQWLAMYAHYKAGFLLRAGGVMDQPNAYLEAMRVIDSTVANERKHSDR